MGLFGQKAKLQTALPTVRVEKVVVPSKPVKPRPSPIPSSAHRVLSKKLSPHQRASTGTGTSASRPKSISPYPSSSDEPRLERKRKAVTSTPRDSPVFDNDTESEDDDGDPFRKRMRRSDGRLLDVNRKLRHKKAFGDGVRKPYIIHAADIASRATKCPVIAGARDDEVAIEVQYPSCCARER